MKLSIKLFILLLFFCFIGSMAHAQELFFRFEKRVEHSKLDNNEPYIKKKNYKRRNVSKVINEFTTDYALLNNKDYLLVADSIAQKRYRAKDAELINDSINYVGLKNNKNELTSDSGLSKKEKRVQKKTEIISDSSDVYSFLEFHSDSLNNETDETSTFNPPPQIALLDTALELFHTNKFEESINYLNAIQKYPATEEYKISYLWNAKAKAALNDLPNALEDLNFFIAINICPGMACSEAYYQRGMVYFKLKGFQNAIDDFSSALADTTFPNLKYCYFYRAYCLGETENYIRTVQDFTKFLNLDKYKSVSSAEALYYRGFYKVKLNDNRGAISDYDLAIEMYSAAYENSKSKNPVYFQKLIDTYITRGLAYAEIKKWTEAIENYNLVIKLQPDYSLGFHLKGLAEIGKGDLDAGCLDLSKAGELGSNEAYNDIKLHCK